MADKTLMLNFLKYDRIAITCVLLAGGGAALYSFLSPPVYRATVQLSLEGGDVVSPITKNPYAMRSYIENEGRILKDKALLADVVEKLHLRLSKKFSSGDPIKTLQRSVKTEVLREQSLINISVYLDNPDLASKVADALAESYLAAKEEKKFSLAQEAIAWFKEANETSGRIKESQDVLNNFIKENKLGSLEENIKKDEALLDGLLKTRETNEAATKRLSEKLERVAGLLKSGDREKLFLELRDNANLAELNNARGAAEMRIVKMKRIYEETHPDIAKLKKSIEEIDDDINALIDNILATDRIELETSKKNAENIAKETAETNERLSGLRPMKTKVDDLARRIDAAKKFHDEVLDRLKEGRFNLIEVTNLGLSDQLNVINTPVGPKKARNTALGMVAGFILGNIISRLRKKGGAKRDEAIVHNAEVKQ